VLTGLRLENIALIERLELSFGGGFTVLTGETGAGKSILLDALDALLGGAQGGQGARLLRRGTQRGRIEASFRLTPPVAAWLEGQELEAEEGELLLSRDWRLQDERLSSRHRLNGVAVSRAQLLDLRPLLLDLTVQGQTQQLARPGQQRRWLDRFAGEELLGPLEAARAAFRAWRQAAHALAAALADGRVAAAGLDVYAKEPCTDSPLFGFEQVVATPHLGASTDEAQEKAGIAVARSVRLALSGELVPDAVNVEGGVIDEDVRPYIDLA
jgi:DNA repair protein RecN (Recombination protein N)